LNGSELFDGVVEAPNDDGPRLVYADWLMQQPEEIARARGEYISLACSATRSPKRSARLKELLEKYEPAWLGPVSKVLDPRRRLWARGFLEGCALNRQTPVPQADHVIDALGHSTWRTLRTLEVYGSPLSLDQQLAILRQPQLANLRSLYAYQTCLEPLANDPGALRISELAVAPAGPPLGQLITLLREPAFERLRKLHVFGCSPEVGCAMARPQLTLIAIAGPSTLASWLAELTGRGATFDEVRLVSSVFPLLARHGVELVMRRAESGRWSALEVRWDDENEPRLRDAVILEVGRLPDGAITHVSFVGPPATRFDVARWKQRIIGALLARTPDLVVS
jgi:uncharacterized protein (TIGR02996 family)